MVKKVECIKNEYKDGRLKYLKGKLYIINEKGNIWELQNEDGEKDFLDIGGDKDKLKEFKKYFKEI